MVEFQPSKLVAWVRFPSLAPIRALSSVDRVPGYEPVGRRFESSRARHKKHTHNCGCVFYFSLCTDESLAHLCAEGSHFACEICDHGSISSGQPPSTVGVFFYFPPRRDARYACAFRVRFSLVKYVTRRIHSGGAQP